MQILLGILYKGLLKNAFIIATKYAFNAHPFVTTSTKRCAILYLVASHDIPPLLMVMNCCVFPPFFKY